MPRRTAPHPPICRGLRRVPSLVTGPVPVVVAPAASATVTTSTVETAVLIAR